MIHLVLPGIAMYLIICLIDRAIGLLHAWCIVRERERRTRDYKWRRDPNDSRGGYIYVHKKTGKPYHFGD